MVVCKLDNDTLMKPMVSQEERSIIGWHNPLYPVDPLIETSISSSGLMLVNAALSLVLQHMTAELESGANLISISDG